MNVEHLRYAIEIGRCGTINKAAQNLYVSQPHLSKSLRILENDIGIEIFQRSKKGVHLTSEGQEFLEYAQNILFQIDNITHKYSERKATDLSIHISCTRSALFMNAFVQLMELYQNHAASLQATIRECTMKDVLQDVATGVADLGFMVGNIRKHAIYDSFFHDGRLEYVPISHFEPYIIVSQQDPFVSNVPMNMQQLQEYTYLAYGELDNSVLGFLSEHRMLKLAVAKKIITVHDRSTLMEFLARKGYYTIAHKMDTSFAQRYGVANIRPKDMLYDVEVGYVKQPEKVLSSREEELVQLVINHVAQRDESGK